ncbi:hypothetical protein MASR1M12_19130 [Erysipelotrichia bacterium]
MKKFQLAKLRRTIVVVGNFDPRFFHPRVLERESLLSPDLADELEPRVIMGDVSDLASSNLQILTYRDRLTVSAFKESCFESIKDFCMNLIRSINFVEPSMLGVNSHHIFKSSSVEDWHRVGDVLAPKSHWNNLINAPGLKSISLASDRDDLHKSSLINVSVDATSFEDCPNCIGLSFNHHSTLAEKSIEEFIDRLCKNWQQCEGYTTEKLEKFLEDLVV